MSEVAPDVLKQFNAIRSRLQGQQPEIETVDTSVPFDTTVSDKRIRAEFGKDETALVGFALNNQPRSKAEFEQAYATYRKVGNRVPGFTFLEPGVAEKLRTGFEAVNQPLQQGAVALDNAVGNMVSADQQFAQAKRGNKGLATIVAESVNTPEKAGATLGTMAIAPAVKGLHFLKQAAGIGLGAGAGSLAADVATGTNQDNAQKRIGNVLQQVVIGGLGQGIVGAFKIGTGQGLSRKAQEQAAGDLVDLLKKEAAPLSNDPRGLHIYGSSRKGANDIITVGIKALRGDIDTMGSELVEDLITKRLNVSARIKTFNEGLAKYGLNAPPIQAPAAPSYISKAVPGQFSADQFVTDFTKSAPFSLSKQTTADVKKYVRQLADQGNTLLDNVAEPEAFAKAQVAMQDTRDKIVTALTSNFSKSSSAVQAAQTLKAEQLVAQHTSQLDKFVDFATVLHYMKQSVGPQGFDPTMMQKLVQYNSGKSPGSLFDKAGNAVFRDAKDRLAGTDATIRAQLPIGQFLSKIPGLDRFPGVSKWNVGKDIGTSFAGRVRGSYPITEAVAGQKTIKTIQSYLEED